MTNTVIAILAFAGTIVFYFLIGIRYISNTKVGVIEKRWSLKGSIASGFIAPNGEAGYQPEVLRGGLHWLPPFQFSVHRVPLVTIPQGKIGYIFARDGVPLAPVQTLASNLEANNFEDALEFLRRGGQRGPQRKILREGTYALNLAQFVVIAQEKLYFLSLHADDRRLFEKMASLIAERNGFHPVVIQGVDDQIAVVTVHDGPSLREGEIIAPVVGDDPSDPQTYHNHFQDPERFLKAGGQRGRQLQVLADGTYYLNALFSTVELVPKTVVEVGTVGVVAWYAGETGADLSGTEYKHGELVKRGERGVWSEALLP